MRGLGVDQSRLKTEEGIVFAVRRVEADYLTPARFDDVLAVETRVEEIGGARITLTQTVRRDNETCFVARVQLVALSNTGRPQRLPEALKRAIAED